MDLQILGASDTGSNRDYESRWGSSQKPSKEQTGRHKSCPREAPPTPGPSSPPRLWVLSPLCTFPQLQPGSLPPGLGWPARLLAGLLDSLEVPSLSFTFTQHPRGEQLPPPFPSSAPGSGRQREL